MDQQLNALERMGEAAKADRAANKVIVEDNALRPFSARLTAKEITRLKALARDEGASPSPDNSSRSGMIGYMVGCDCDYDRPGADHSHAPVYHPSHPA